MPALGHIDAVKTNQINGWLFDQDRPGHRCRVLVLHEDTVVAEAQAADLRPDLMQASIGDGYHAFSLEIDLTEFKTGALRVLEKDSGVELIGSPIDLDELLADPLSPNGASDTSTRNPPVAGADAGETLGDVLSELTDGENPNGLVFQALFEIASLVPRTNTGQSLLAAGADLDRLVAGYIGGDIALESAAFSDTEYLALHSDLRVGQVRPLVHFSRFGRRERRSPTILFFYPAPDEGARTDGKDDPYLQFLRGTTAVGWHPTVDSGWVRRNPHLSAATNLDVLESITANKVDSHPLFDRSFYAAQLPRSERDRIGCLLKHYLHSGWKYGIDPHPLFDGQYYRVDQKNFPPNKQSIASLTLFLTARDESQFSPSPFIDIKFMRHMMHMDGYQYTGDPQLIIDAFATEWTPAHPHIQRNMIEAIMGVSDPSTLAKPSVTMRDLAALIGALRLGELPAPADEVASDARVPAPEAASDPEVSVVILNFQKPIYTILSAFSSVQACRNRTHEVIVADNGSDPFVVEMLYRYLHRFPAISILSHRRNTFFGEGNNLAIEQTRGRYVLLLNNDAVLEASTVDTLLNFLAQNPDYGMLAPVIVLPDGRVQEVGGMISGCGSVIQRAKIRPLSNTLNMTRRGPVIPCDYASAACCVITRDALGKVLGFDNTFEPFYFEDTDLCARVKAHGYKLGVHLDAFGVHFENASTREVLGSSMQDVIARQRLRFARRWYGSYEYLGNSTVARETERFDIAERYDIRSLTDVSPGYSGRAIAWIYTHFDIRVGGGERYILALASALAEEYEVWLLTPQRASKTRVAMTMDDLGIAPGQLHLATLDDTGDWPRPHLFVAMGNEIEPPVASYGRYNIYHCQFPFPIHMAGRFSIERLKSYDAILVNSKYTRDNVLREMARYRIEPVDTWIAHPPVRALSAESREALLADIDQGTQRSGIANIGRFTNQGHSKRQDFILSVAEKAITSGLEGRFYLCGGLGNDPVDVAYFQEIAAQAAIVDAELRTNASRQEIEQLLSKSAIYFHACGAGCFPGVYPERMEHFGITIVEAMAHGAIPLVYEWGGPAETVRATGIGDTYADAEEARAKLVRHFALPPAERAEMARAAIEASLAYRDEAFARTVRDHVASLMDRKAA